VTTVVAGGDFTGTRIGTVAYLRSLGRWYRTAVAIAVTTAAFGLLLLAGNAYADHRQAVLRHERLAQASKLFGPASPYARFHLEADDFSIAPFRLSGPHAIRELVAVFVVLLLLAILIHRRRTIWAAAVLVTAVVGVAIGAGPLANLVQPNSLRVLNAALPLRPRPGASVQERAVRLKVTFEPSTFHTSASWRVVAAFAALALLAAFVVAVRRLPSPPSSGAAPAVLDFLALIATIVAFVFLLFCWPTTDTESAILGVNTGPAREFVGSLALYAVTFGAGVVAIRSTRIRSRR
jgi:hypothetical protein